MRRLTATLLVLTSAALHAQQQPPPVFRAAADLVEVDVVVHDRGGRFVGDLAAEDFAIAEGDAPQTIQQFYLQTGEPSDSRSVNAPGATAGPGRRAEAPQRFFIVVFDERHLSPAGFKRTQAAALSLFERQFRAGDIGGVLIGGRMVKDRLTGDREELLEAIRTAKPNLAGAARLFDARTWPRLTDLEAVRIVLNNDATVLGEAVRRACAEDESQCRVATEAVRAKAQELASQSRAHSAQTLQILATALNGLARFDGRKTILLMSEGFMAEQSWPLVQDAVGLAARSNARIYTLDARGLDRPLRTTSDVDPVGSDGTARMLEQMDFGADAINSLAVDTGGFVVRNVNQFDDAIDRIADDVSRYYVLGYRPTTPQDGKLHAIRVAVRRPGVSVRSRRGYLAVANAAPDRSTSAAIAGSPGPEETRSDVVPPETRAETRAAAAPTATTTGGALPSSEPASAARARLHAAENAQRLAPSGGADSDATAGWAAFQRGDVDTAFARLSTSASRPDAHMWVHYTLGISSYALGRFKEAAEAWERVRAGAAAFEPAYFDLIDAYLQQRDYDRATRIARAALERWPQDPEIYQALGVVQTVRGSLDDAVKSFREALALAPDDANVYFNLGKAMELRYFKSRRWVDQLRRWISNEADRTAAIENYRRHIELQGVYADSARAGLQRLEWVPTQKQ